MTEGLTSDIAIRRLRDAVELEAKRYGERISFGALLSLAFFHRFPTSTCWVLLCLSFVSLISFIFSPLFAAPTGRYADIQAQEHVFGSSVLLLILLSATCVLNVYFVYLRKTEIRRKINAIVNDLDDLIEDGVVGLTTPSLYEPASESITLQWTYRDGVLVNLPWMALVEGDIILLRPGREIPCRCRPVGSTIEYESGLTYIPHESRQVGDTIGVDAFVPLPCRVEETPAASYVRACLSAPEHPCSLTENEYGRIMHFYVERIGVPVILGISLSAAVFIYMYKTERDRDWYELLVLGPAAVILPLTLPLLSLYTWTFVLIHTARFLVRFANVLNSTTPLTGGVGGEPHREDAELFTETSISADSSRATEQSHASRWFFFSPNCSGWSKCLRLVRVLWKLLNGNPAGLPFSANVVQTLGNVTSLSVVDKKGIMSWANPAPEKVFFFSPARHKRQQQQPSAVAAATSMSRKRDRHPSTTSLHSFVDESESNEIKVDETVVQSRSKTSHLTVDAAQWTPIMAPRNRTTTRLIVSKVHHQSAAARAHTEVLDLSHDPYRSFVVHFDDPQWRTFSGSLKPLGLNILLNSCNLHAEYIRFIDHVHAISAVVPRTVAVVNRRCLCYLAKAIGFNRTSCSCEFETQQTLAAYRKTPGELPLPGLTKHKTPLPNLFAVMARDKITGHGQLMCQGTADLIAEACDYYWDGTDVKPLEKQHRKKINDFAQRHSMTAYCVAFSYRPLAVDVDRTLGDVYVDWPTISSRQLDNSSDSLLTASASDDMRPWNRVISYDSLLTDEYFDVKVIHTPSQVMNRLLNGQVFLGMISLQYQAKSDVVRLVDSLDKACIRFVHYSKENELRSRIFAEKCGLEAGWNCHISLGKESEAISVAGSHLGSQQIAKVAIAPPPASSTVSASRHALKWSVARKPSRRRSLPTDYKIGLPTVHFKSATATPINETLPKVICTTTDDGAGGNGSIRNGIAMVDGGQEDDEDAGDDSSTTKGGTSSLVDRCASVATISGDSIFDDPSDQQLISALRSKRERTPLLSDATSRTSVATNHSSGNQPISMPPNRARLPKGIENVRPHLENVDNVPLLVPLFTDCYPTATVEMISVMQEYGEVVCVLGSALNYRNAEIFCQANASIGIEPLHPAVCMNRSDQRHRSETTTDTTTDSALSATDLATLISTLPCSISIFAGEHINLLDLIATSRHFLMVLRTSWLFYLAASLMTTGVQVFAQLVALPRPFTIDLLIWLVCVVIPLLSGSLCATPQHLNVLKTATPKNSNWVSKNAVKKFLFGFGLRFVPSSLIALLLFKCSLILTCATTSAHDSERCGSIRNDSSYTSALSASDFSTNFTTTIGGINRDGSGDTDLSMVAAVGLTMSRHLFTFMFVLYLCAISSGFVHYRSLFKEHLPYSNVVWLLIVIFVLFAQFFYTILCVGRVLHGLNTNLGRVLSINLAKYIPWKVYLCGLTWPLISLPLNELLKRYELGRYHRDQRRRRLSFGTKLGMNSPF